MRNSVTEGGEKEEGMSNSAVLPHSGEGRTVLKQENNDLKNNKLLKQAEEFFFLWLLVQFIIRFFF